ncbi:hypothetical protein [Rhodococcus sp. SGAir0479]|uniref:hypothetical protein n=1 Tax=Rhodococcus sp. SGAir0479 TaxID=2567884 RepID=UPI0010CCF01A|nr:hypothetical protein [Rhodococcus sp. SGAir0479]QCQ91746.1 hypothetical protein E7742_11230 [Rhodococcus sp. SGAir0479]
MSGVDPSTIRAAVAAAQDAPPAELPPYPTDTGPQVRDLAKGLRGLLFGHLDQPQAFRSHDQFYAPLAQAILNRLHGWVIDPESKQWKRMEE